MSDEIPEIDLGKLFLAMEADARRANGVVPEDDYHSPASALARQRERDAMEVRQRLREHFTRPQRRVLADMIRVVCDPDAPVAGTPDRIIDMLEND